MPLLLGLGFIVQLVFAMVAEYNEEYLKAIYEMTWAGLFLYLLHRKEEKKDD
tara:strand:- start:214 stop:369 length:156 start_codon:yes stop_codon:yes gene_type:complete